MPGILRRTIEFFIVHIVASMAAFAWILFNGSTTKANTTILYLVAFGLIVLIQCFMLRSYFYAVWDVKEYFRVNYIAYAIFIVLSTGIYFFFSYLSKQQPAWIVHFFDLFGRGAYVADCLKKLYIFTFFPITIFMLIDTSAVKSIFLFHLVMCAVIALAPMGMYQALRLEKHAEKVASNEDENFDDDYDDYDDDYDD